MEIEFSLPDGREPVADFLSEIKDQKAHRKIVRNLELFEETPLGFMMHSGFMDKVKGFERYDLWEFRSPYNGLQYRILCTIRDKKCYLLHGFTKKRDKLPLFQISTAITRIKANFNLNA